LEQINAFLLLLKCSYFLLFFGLVQFFYDLRFYCHFHDQIQVNKIKVTSTFVYLGSNTCFTIKLHFQFNSDLFTKCIAQDFVLVIAVKITFTHASHAVQTCILIRKLNAHIHYVQAYTTAYNFAPTDTDATSTASGKKLFLKQEVLEFRERKIWKGTSYICHVHILAIYLLHG
jgi:hypothetical protein